MSDDPLDIVRKAQRGALLQALFGIAAALFVLAATVLAYDEIRSLRHQVRLLQNGGAAPVVIDEEEPVGSAVAPETDSEIPTPPPAAEESTFSIDLRLCPEVRNGGGQSLISSRAVRRLMVQWQAAGFVVEAPTFDGARINLIRHGIDSREAAVRLSRNMSGYGIGRTDTLAAEALRPNWAEVNLCYSTYTVE